jgi:hypothetical protein
MIQHKKAFGVYHWDTFDNETLLVDEADTLEEADAIINERYKGRIAGNGADKVDVVDRDGRIVKQVSVC